MNDKKILERINNGYKELYDNSTHCLPIEHKFSLSELEELSYKSNEGTWIPFELFYLDDEQYKKIVENQCKYVHSWWRWPYRTEPSTMNYTMEDANKELEEIKSKYTGEEYKKAVSSWERKYENPRFLEYISKMDALKESLNNKDITKKEYNKKVATLSKSYGCYKYSRAKESIRVSLYLGYGPTSDISIVKNTTENMLNIEPGLSFEEVNQKHGLVLAKCYMFWEAFKLKNHI